MVVFSFLKVCYVSHVFYDRTHVLANSFLGVILDTIALLKSKISARTCRLLILTDAL